MTDLDAIAPQPDDDPEGTGPLRRVLMSTTLFRELGASAVDWGAPDAEGFYTPTVHTATWDKLAPLLARIRALEAREAALREGLAATVTWIDTYEEAMGHSYCASQSGDFLDPCTCGFEDMHDRWRALLSDAPVAEETPQ